jgi:hypothetical protein
MPRESNARTLHKHLYVSGTLPSADETEHLCLPCDPIATSEINIWYMIPYQFKKPSAPLGYSCDLSKTLGPFVMMLTCPWRSGIYLGGSTAINRF